MRRSKIVSSLLIPLAALAFTVSARAQGSGGGGKGELYGDLYVIERDGNGAPVLDALGCKQPIAADCSFIPLVGTSASLLFEEEDPCEIDPAYLEQAQEVEMGRLSVARADPRVIEASYAEALDIINTALRIRLDPAGRFEMVVPNTSVPGTLIRRTIDAPLENLGLYATLLKNGCLTPIETHDGIHALTAGAEDLLRGAGLGHLVCPVEGMPDPEGVLADDMMTAAPFFAAAADKAAFVSLDAFINVNTYLGINQIDNQGNVTYFEWRDPITGEWFFYDRSVHFPPGQNRWLLTLLKAPDKFLAKTVDVSGPQGAEFPAVQVCRAGAVYPFTCDGVDPGGECGGANWMTQRGEHARSIVWFMHNWAVPELF